MDQDFSSLGQIFQAKQTKTTKKPPAYPWQDLALEVIKDLAVPAFKRNSVFKVCKTLSRERVLMALNDTKELCPRGEKWKYFFKIVAGEIKPKTPPLSAPGQKGIRKTKV